MKQYQICTNGTWRDTVDTVQIDYYARCYAGLLRVKPYTRVKNTIIAAGKRKVCRIWDNQGKTLDRYTIAFKGYRLEGYGMVYPYLASSTNPFHEFGQHEESKEFMKGKHLGKRVAFEGLPDDVKKFILQSI